MDDEVCVRFLQWALPRQRMRWRGFRKVRRQVCKRAHRRLIELGLETTSAYQSYLDSHPDEWKRLDSFCRITISRFYRDRRFFEHLEETVLPSVYQLALERGDGEIRCWSVGCASGEEPYSINVLWKSNASYDLPLRISATDADEGLLHRARCARYPKSSLREVPEKWVRNIFELSGEGYRPREMFRQGVTFLKQDIRHEFPAGEYHLILCRNLVFTYFEEGLQRQVLGEVFKRLIPEGVFAVAPRESLPGGDWPVEVMNGKLGTYVKTKKTLRIFRKKPLEDIETEAHR